MIKYTYFIPNESILFNGKRLVAFPLKPRRGCPVSISAYDHPTLEALHYPK